MNHVTVGLYSNESYVYNIVKEEHLEQHIEYNKSMRPGRALFLDGKCIYKGYLCSELIEIWEMKISKMNFNLLTPTIPYR